MFVGDRLARRSPVGEILGPLGNVLTGETSQRQLTERWSDVLLQIGLVIPDGRLPETGQVLDVVLDPLSHRHRRHLRIGA